MRRNMKTKAKIAILRNTSSEVKSGTENLSTFVEKGKVSKEKRIINRPPERKWFKNVKDDLEDLGGSVG